MRLLTAKYGGDCVKCGAHHEPGDQVGYERRVGIFCPACMPTDPEEIRAYRTEGVERKAGRLEAWAAKREALASKTLNSNPRLRHDWAFITQPGHIPERARMNRADDRACASLQKAEKMRERARSLRVNCTRVAGDAERRHDEQNEAAKSALVADGLRVGSKITDSIYPGVLTVVRLNPKTVTVQTCSGFRDKSPYRWVRLHQAEPAAALEEGGAQ